MSAPGDGGAEFGSGAFAFGGEEGLPHIGEKGVGMGAGEVVGCPVLGGGGFNHKIDHGEALVGGIVDDEGDGAGEGGSEVCAGFAHLPLAGRDIESPPLDGRVESTGRVAAMHCGCLSER